MALKEWLTVLTLAACWAMALWGSGCGWAAQAAPPVDAASPAASPADSAAPRPDYSRARIAGVPHVRQKPDFCGEACAAMVLAKLGQRIDQDDVFDQADVDPELGRGCHTQELAQALTRIGFHVGKAWHSVAAARAATELEDQFRALHADLADGVPNIVCMHYDDQPETSEHFRLVLGYDPQTDEVLYHEPAVADGAYQRMKRSLFLQLWPLKYDAERWTLIRLRLVPGAIREVHSTARFTDADYAQRVLALRRRAPDGFSFVVQKPFVVLGDQSASEVRGHAVGTIQWAVDRLKAEYFERDPDTIIDIWLFRDRDSYDKHTQEIFGDTPDTPFGYFSHRHQALIMNIDTGTGTLVHEIVHPFVAANFPDCPAWFNEGLASLYEQCGEYRGRIWGRTNWRLAGLQKAILPPEPAVKAPAQPPPADAGESPAEDEAAVPEELPPRKPLPTFQQLCSTSTYAFYGADPGTNYAQARYLCYYLQQQGQLREYYQRFRRNARSDPSGYETLKAVLGIQDEEGMARFEEAWKAWVLQLRYP